jgi:hypothetical protein
MTMPIKTGNAVEWRDSYYSRRADRINTQPDLLRGEGGHDAELAR